MSEKSITLKILGVAALIAIVLAVIAGCQNNNQTQQAGGTQQQTSTQQGDGQNAKIAAPSVLFFHADY